MELKQKLQLRHLLTPELTQSLKVLSLPLINLVTLIEQELNNNPLLEEAPSLTFEKRSKQADYELAVSLLSKKPSLQDILMRQLGMFANSEQDLKIGQEIIGNIDENGYLKITIEEVACSCDCLVENAVRVLKLIQQFEPAGVCARSISECLAIQLELAGENDPLLKKIVDCYLEDVAKKNYSRIAKALNEPPDKIEHLIKKILCLDPKPGRNYSSEEAHRVIPDIVIQEKGDELEISINDEDIPTVNINKAYKKMLKDKSLDPETRRFLTEKLSSALTLMRSVFKRKLTLRKIMEAIIEIQCEAIRGDLSCLKPLTFKDIALKIQMHETTVCRAIMNKYALLPHGIVALKDFFSSRIQTENKETVSSNLPRKQIKELIDKEDKKHPLSDKQITDILSKESGLKLARRTVAKYREELKVPSSVFRKER